MRAIAVFPIVLIAAQLTTGQPAPKPGKLSGVVVNAITGEPVRKVQVRLSKEVSGRGGMAQSASVATDAQGRFAFEGIEAATYRLSAQKPGFLSMQYGARRGSSRGTPIKLDQGQELEVEFKILPQGVISGRIVDEDGDAIANATVAVMRITPSSRGTEESRTAATNDLGEFRIPNLPTGKYHVLARIGGRRFGGEGLTVARRDEPEQDYAPTYFPGAIEITSSAAVEVTPGKEVSGIQFALIKAPVYRVRGKVNATAALPPNMMVNLVPKGAGRGRWLDSGAGGRVKPDGSFEIQQVRRGSYSLMAAAMERGPRAMGKAQVEVSGDVDNVIVTMSPPISISGSVKIEGQSEPNYGSGQVFLRPLESSGPGGSAGRVKADGSFRIENLGPEKFIVIPFGFPDNLYLRSVRLGNQAVTGELDLANAGPGIALSIVLSPNAAVVEGVVKEKDKPAAGVQVSLLPDPMDAAAAWRVKQATADQNGNFSLKGIAPGNYRLYGLTESVLAADLDPEFLKGYLSQSTKVVLKESARERAEVELIDLDPEKK